jgi:hypothetical protein
MLFHRVKFLSVFTILVHVNAKLTSKGKQNSAETLSVDTQIYCTSLKIWQNKLISVFYSPTTSSNPASVDSSADSATGVARSFRE